MKRLYACTLALALALALAGPASATDWTGWYVGGHVGYADGRADTRTSLGGFWSSESLALRDEVVAGLARDLDSSGAAYGLHLGYDHGFSNGLLLGGELEYSRLDLDESRVDGPRPTATFPSLSYTYANGLEIDNSLALRGKIGYAGASNAVYAILGTARVDVDVAAGIASNGGYAKAGGSSGSETALVYGVGYAYDFGNDWTLRAELTRTDVGDVEFETVYLPGSAFTDPAYSESIERDVTVDTLRVGLSYRF